MAKSQRNDGSQSTQSTTIIQSRAQSATQPVDLDAVDLSEFLSVLDESAHEDSSDYGGSGHLNRSSGVARQSEPSSSEATVDPRNSLNALTGREWIQETKSVWFQKGLGQSHPHARIERLHPAPFSYQDVARLILFFSKPGGLVLDPFSGVGSTLKACALEGRHGIGVELIPYWAELSAERLRLEVSESALESQRILVGDSRKVLAGLDSESIDFIVTSPPYWNILEKERDYKAHARIAANVATKYSDSPDDLGNLSDYGAFLDELTKVFAHCYRLLRPAKYAAVVVSDFRHESRFYAFHSDLIDRLTNPSDILPVPYELQGVKVLVQNHKGLYPYGYPFAYVENVHHQYILILRKGGSADGSGRGRRNGR